MHLDATGHAGPEAIVAFIDGATSLEVASHIQGCAMCSSDAAALQTAQVRLRQSLYRFDCPEPHRLGEYELGELEGCSVVGPGVEAVVDVGDRRLASNRTLGDFEEIKQRPGQVMVGTGVAQEADLAGVIRRV